MYPKNNFLKICHFLNCNNGIVFLFVDNRVAIKVLEHVADSMEEIEEEYRVFRDLSKHPNLPAFHGMYLKRGPSREDDQLWFVMEVKINLSLFNKYILKANKLPQLYFKDCFIVVQFY